MKNTEKSPNGIRPTLQSQQNAEAAAQVVHQQQQPQGVSIEAELGGIVQGFVFQIAGLNATLKNRTAELRSAQARIAELEESLKGLQDKSH